MNGNQGIFDRRRVIKTASLGGVLAASPLMAPGLLSAAPATPVSTSLPDRLEPVIEGVMQSTSIPGANVLVKRRGAGNWTAAFGGSDIEAGTPMSPAMHMRIGSITKTMTATVVLQLIDAGALAFDGSLGASLPDLAGFPYAEQITIRQLLGMTSGVFDLLDDESFLGQIMDDPGRGNPCHIRRPDRCHCHQSFDLQCRRINDFHIGRPPHVDVGAS